MKQTAEEKAYLSALKEQRRITTLMATPGLPAVEMAYYQKQLDRLYIPNPPKPRKRYRPAQAHDEGDDKLAFIRSNRRHAEGDYMYGG